MQEVLLARLTDRRLGFGDVPQNARTEHRLADWAGALYIGASRAASVRRSGPPLSLRCCQRKRSLGWHSKKSHRVASVVKRTAMARPFLSTAALAGVTPTRLRELADLRPARPWSPVRVAARNGRPTASAGQARKRALPAPPVRRRQQTSYSAAAPTPDRGPTIGWWGEWQSLGATRRRTRRTCPRQWRGVAPPLHHRSGQPGEWSPQARSRRCQSVRVRGRGRCCQRHRGRRRLGR